MFRQVANPTSKWKQTATAGRGMFPELADFVCGQQRTDGDITLRTNEEVGEPEPEEPGQGKNVSDQPRADRRGDLRSYRSLSLRDVRDIKRLYLSGKSTCMVIARETAKLMTIKGIR